MPGTYELFDHASVARLPPHEDGWSENARHLVSTIQPLGLQSFIKNADYGIELIRAEGRLMPLVVSRRSRERLRAEVCSPLSHYVFYTGEEAARRTSGLSEFQAHLARFPLRLLVDWGGCEKAVYVNEWLWATAVPLPPVDIQGLTAWLVDTFPDHAIVYRGVLPGIDAQQSNLYRESGCRFLRSRTVFVVDTRADDYHRASNIKNDLALYQDSAYEVVSDPDELIEHTDRLAELYTQLYIGKYSKLNQRYLNSYMRMILGNGAVDIHALRKNQQIDGFFGVFRSGGMMGAPFIGYDLGVSRESGLYRQIFALLVQLAETERCVFNMSSGVGGFKQARRAHPENEYWAIYDRHLPLRRRVPWAGLEKAVRLQIARHAWAKQRAVKVKKGVSQ